MIIQAIKQSQMHKTSIEKISYVLKLVLRAVLIATFIVLLVLFGVMAICYVDSLYNTKNGISKSPLFGAYVIVTESMIPTIKVNDAVIIKRVDDSNVNIGDIITFSSNDKKYTGLTITHRVVGKQLSADGDYIYRTKGDNNILEDTALVNLENIYGKVLFKIPKIGYIQKFVSSPAGFVMSIVIPVIIIIFYEVYRVRKVAKEKYAEIEII